MASLINRIQRAFLGSAGPEKVRALLTELAIPAGGSGENALRAARRGFLRPISDEAILRDALSGLGLAGGGSGARPITHIRSAILHNLSDSETTLRDGLNDLLAAEDLAGGGEESWIPEGAKIHIDFVGGDPQGRAWVDGTGVVAVDTLLGSDPNTENQWDTTSYNAGHLTADGYVSDNPTAFIGVARSTILAGSTMAVMFKPAEGATEAFELFALANDEDGNGVGLNGYTDLLDVEGTAFNGAPFETTLNGVLVVFPAVNKIAMTHTPTRLEFAANGSSVSSNALDASDVGSPYAMVAVVLDGGTTIALQSITIYDPLPSTDGLSELSEIA